jgi:hypothetical protein
VNASKRDKDALARLPIDKWFTVRDVLHLLGGKPRFRLNRLVALGWIEKERCGLEPEFIRHNAGSPRQEEG